MALAHPVLADTGSGTFLKGWDLTEKEEPLASQPSGVYQHSDGRPLLGRKLKGKSQRELRDLGLLVEGGNTNGVIAKEAMT